MATPIKTIPKLSDAQLHKFSKELEAKRHDKIAESQKAEMRVLLEKVLANKK